MRLLHSRHGPGFRRFAATQPRSIQNRNQGGPGGQSLPMHRLSEDCGRCSDGRGFTHGRERFMREVILPRTLEDLWEILEKKPGAVLYAGGTDLLVKARAGAIDPPVPSAWNELGLYRAFGTMGKKYSLDRLPRTAGLLRTLSFAGTSRCWPNPCPFWHPHPFATWEQSEEILSPLPLPVTRCRRFTCLEQKLKSGQRGNPGDFL